MAESKRSRGQTSQRGEQRWYWVKAAYKAVRLGAPRRRHLWETTVFLIQAAEGSDERDPVLLREKAERIARSKECEYLAAGGDTVRWTFQGIEDIQCLVDVATEDGAEVYWEFFERVDRKPA
jgi:hypothetical protein